MVDRLPLGAGFYATAWFGGHWRLRCRARATELITKTISCTVMAAFEIDANGRICQWRENYDLKSVTDQIEAAGYEEPG